MVVSKGQTYAAKKVMVSGVFSIWEIAPSNLFLIFEK
jgi:hypothetical protein